MNDQQLLLQLTSDVIAHENFVGRGRRVNGKHGYVLRHCPLVRKLIDTGVCTLQRGGKEGSWCGGLCRYNYLIHSKPRDTKAVCPCCNKIVYYAPEIGMSDHSKDCRLRVYYDRPKVKKIRTKQQRLAIEAYKNKIYRLDLVMHNILHDNQSK